MTQILIVEDDPAIRRLVTMVLQRAHYEVQTASDGVEAVLKLGLHEFDVVILDLMMPNLDGFAMLETFGREDPELLKKIIVTSAASPGVIRERMKAMPFEVLPKPFDIQDLLAVVRRCVGGGG